MLAAANSIYGRWDDTKGAENIDFMPTILSRFDMIYIVKDEHNEARDKVSSTLTPGNAESDRPGRLFSASLRTDLLFWRPDITCFYYCFPVSD